jgi:outer membrane lipoprotein SlyB
MRKPSRFLSFSATALLLGTLAACGTPPPPPQEHLAVRPSPYPAGQVAYPAAPQPAYVEYGRVANIEVIRTQQPGQSSGAGAVIGGIAGAVIGHQFGGGFGRDAATVAGAVGGGVIGNNIERRNQTTVQESYRVSIQVDNGAYRAYDVGSPGDLRIGDRVRIDNGRISRI